MIELYLLFTPFILIVIEMTYLTDSVGMKEGTPCSNKNMKSSRNQGCHGGAHNTIMIKTEIYHGAIKLFEEVCRRPWIHFAMQKIAKTCQLRIKIDVTHFDTLSRL
jgi:hypothetical protein